MCWRMLVISALNANTSCWYLRNVNREVIGQFQWISSRLKSILENNTEFICWLNDNTKYSVLVAEKIDLYCLWNPQWFLTEFIKIFNMFFNKIHYKKLWKRHFLKFSRYNYPARWMNQMYASLFYNWLKIFFCQDTKWNAATSWLTLISRICVFKT